MEYMKANADEYVEKKRKLIKKVRKLRKVYIRLEEEKRVRKE